MATLKTYYSSDLTDAGEVDYHTRMLGIPLEVTLTDGTVMRRDVELPSYDGSTKKVYTLWEWVKDVDEDFAAILIENLGTGIIHIQWKGTKPMSSDDSTPDPGYETWNTVAIAPHVPFYIGSDAILVNSDPAKHAGGNGPLNETTEVAGKIYKIEAWNPDTSKAQTVRMTRFN